MLGVGEEAFDNDQRKFYMHLKWLYYLIETFKWNLKQILTNFNSSEFLGIKTHVNYFFSSFLIFSFLKNIHTKLKHNKIENSHKHILKAQVFSNTCKPIKQRGDRILSSRAKWNLIKSALNSLYLVQWKQKSHTNMKKTTQYGRRRSLSNNHSSLALPHVFVPLGHKDQGGKSGLFLMGWRGKLLPMNTGS